MKIERHINSKGLAQLNVTISNVDAELLQIAVLQFAEKLCNTKKHTAKMRRLAILIDKKL